MDNINNYKEDYVEKEQTTQEIEKEVKDKIYIEGELPKIESNTFEEVEKQILSWLEARSLNKEENRLTNITSNFDIIARNNIISKRLRSILLIREEELLATINDAQHQLDEFKNVTKEMSERDIQKAFTNQQLMDINRIRTQLIPGLFMELETLVTAIESNETIFSDSTASLANLESSIRFKLSGGNKNVRPGKICECGENCKCHSKEE